MEISEWNAEIERERKVKDRFFGSSYPGSPISPQDRHRFKGLEYYPPDPDYRFELELHEHSKKQVVRMAYTKGNEEDFLRWGEFRFKKGEKEQVLQAYKRNSQEETLFVPFRDSTSGKETSEDYTCPFVPGENWLEVAIEAGEKNYPLKKD